MIIKYPLQDGKVYELDFDSEDLKQVSMWAAKILGATTVKATTSVAMYDFGVPDVPEGKVVFVSGNIVFMIPGISDQVYFDTYSVDARTLFTRPEETVTGIVLSLGLNVNIKDLKYVDPDAGKPALEDWEIPDAVIGPPLASIPGGFVFKQDGKSEGYQYYSPSMKKYVLTKFSIGFASFYYWKLI